MMFYSSRFFWLVLLIPLTCLHTEELEKQEEDEAIDSEWEIEESENPTYAAAAAAVAIALEQGRSIEEIEEEPEFTEELPIAEAIATAIKQIQFIEFEEEGCDESLLGKAKTHQEAADRELEFAEEPRDDPLIEFVAEETEFSEETPILATELPVLEFTEELIEQTPSLETTPTPSPQKNKNQPLVLFIEDEPWDESPIAFVAEETEFSEETPILAIELPVIEAIVAALEQSEFIETEEEPRDEPPIEFVAEENEFSEETPILATELPVIEAIAATPEQAEFIETEEEPLDDPLTEFIAEENEFSEETPILVTELSVLEFAEEPIKQTPSLETTPTPSPQKNKKQPLVLLIEEEPWDEPPIAFVSEEVEFSEETPILATELPVTEAIAAALEQSEFIETDDENPEETLLGKARARKNLQYREQEFVQETPITKVVENEQELVFGEETPPRDDFIIDFVAEEEFSDFEEPDEAIAAVEEKGQEELILAFVDEKEIDTPMAESQDDELAVEFGVTDEEFSDFEEPDEAIAVAEEKEQKEPIVAFIDEEEICTPIAASQDDELEVEFGVTEEDTAQETLFAAEEEAGYSEEAIATTGDEAPVAIEFGIPEEEQEEYFLVEDEYAIEEPIAGKEVCIDTETPQERPIISNVRGLVLIDNQDNLLDDETLKEIEGFCVLGFSVPGNPKDLQSKLNPIYLNQPLDLSKINVIKQAIHEYFQANHNPFVLVSVPKQCISYGVLQLVVTEAKVGNIRVEGNRWFSDKCLKQYVKAQPGQGINVDTLQTDLNFINRNPFRQVNIVYAPGKQTGTTDLVLAAEDRPPFRIYAGADDTGLLTTGRERIFGGLTWGKVLGFDHILSYQYTASYNLKSFQSHTLQYMMLFPWKHTLNLYGGYSTVHAALPFPEATNLGISSQLSLRYTLPFQTTPRFSDEFSFGFDYKSSNNTIQYSQLFPNVAKQVNLTQLVFEYHLNKEWNTSRLEFTGELYGSPFTFLANQSEADYETLRPNADTKWFYGKGSLRFTRKLPLDFALTIWGRGQFAVGNLLPSEQFGIGGHATVRGYEERQLNMDNGFIGNIEFRTPPISLISTFRKHPIKDSIQFIGFLDYGVGTNNTTLPGEPNYDYLFSIGPGVRYTLDPYIAARLDWGVKLHNAALFSGGWSMIHFSGTISY